MRFLVTLFVYLLTCNLAFAISLGFSGGNNSNKHNLSNKSSNIVKATTETRICVFCHTPHGASPQSALWNRKAPAQTGFALYSSSTLNIDDAAIVADSQYVADSNIYPNGATRMCLSCHDGVSAVGETLSSSSKIIMTSDFLTGSAVVDLASSHPVSFVYNSTVKDYLNTTSGGGLDGRTDYVLPVSVPLDSLERMQCTTCHDPHEDTRNSPTYNLPFWRNYSGGLDEVTDYDSTCGDCHRGNDWGGTWGTPSTTVPSQLHQLPLP